MHATTNLAGNGARSFICAPCPSAVLPFPKPAAPMEASACEKCAAAGAAHAPAKVLVSPLRGRAAMRTPRLRRALRARAAAAVRRGLPAPDVGGAVENHQQRGHQGAWHASERKPTTFWSTQRSRERVAGQAGAGGGVPQLRRPRGGQGGGQGDAALKGWQFGRARRNVRRHSLASLLWPRSLAPTPGVCASRARAARWPASVTHCAHAARLRAPLLRV